MRRREKPPIMPRLAILLWVSGPTWLAMGVCLRLPAALWIGGIISAIGLWYLWASWPLKFKEWVDAHERSKWGNR